MNLKQLDTLRPMMINGIKYQDGSHYTNITRFSKVIEPEKAVALFMGDDREESRLPLQN